jgi:hypothetical protein
MMAAAVKTMARNKSPLPKNTVEKKRSSLWPSRSRSTPMNHRKATPSNGTRFMASATVLEFVSSQAPGSSGSVGTERRSNKTISVNKIEKTIPAIAAAFGVFRLVRVSVSPLDITDLASPDAASKNKAFKKPPD